MLHVRRRHLLYDLSAVRVAAIDGVFTVPRVATGSMTNKIKDLSNFELLGTGLNAHRMVTNAHGMVANA